MNSRFLCFFALFFGIGVASPLLIILVNKDDMVFSPLWFAVLSIVFVLLVSGVFYVLAEKTRFARAIATACLAGAFVFAVQGNIVHELFYYGGFNGDKTNWRQYGWVFWAEWVGFLLAFPLFYWLLRRLKQIPAWLALMPVISSVLVVLPVLLNQQGISALGLADDDVTPEVFEVSSELNLVHLLPDGFQGDIAREVLEDHPELAARLEGFILYRDHLGLYQGTAPSIPTIFTGRRYDFEAGYDPQRIDNDIQMYGYPARLKENGFRLDYVALSQSTCLRMADSCIARPFNDLKSRGYFRYKEARYAYAIRQLADLTLFRHLPMFVKERIYNQGNWLFADTTLDGSSPWPDPVLREWIDRMHVGGPQPRYKWYHYIGTHIPPHWDANCVYSRELERKREQYYDQSVCILTGIARFADKLRELGVYDQTAIIVSGDHGVNIAPDDLQGMKSNASLYAGVLGAARPTLMIKPMKNNNPFQISKAPTSLIDIARSALALAGLDSDAIADYPGQSVLDIDPDAQRTRIFNRYTSADFWSGEPISNEVWKVDGASQNLENWSLQDVFYKHTAASDYAAINYGSAYESSRGFSLNRSKPDEESSWIGGSEFSILVGTSRPALPATIELELSLPDFMTAATQSFTVTVNHQQLEKTYTLDNQPGWTKMTVPLPDGLLLKGNNLVTLKFSETAKPENRDDWYTAGKVKRFSLVQ